MRQLATQKIKSREKVQVQKHKYLTFLICLIMYFSFFQHAAMAESSMQLSVSSQGNIRYSSPTSINKVKVPDDFTNEINAWDYIVLDTSVYRSSPSTIRLDADNTTRHTRECNTHWFNVKPGDHIVWGVWCRTDGLDSDNTIYTGGRIGIDLYGNCVIEGTSQIVCIVESLPRNFVFIDGKWRSGVNTRTYTTIDKDTNLPTPLLEQFIVPWGNTEWTYIYWDFIVPDTTYSFTAQYAGEPPTQIIGCIPWIDAREYTENHAWFDDSEFYINP